MPVSQFEEGPDEPQDPPPDEGGETPQPDDQKLPRPDDAESDGAQEPGGPLSPLPVTQIDEQQRAADLDGRAI
jgi:hypothetical protein